jgi:hypothetical protein
MAWDGWLLFFVRLESRRFAPVRGFGKLTSLYACRPPIKVVVHPLSIRHRRLTLIANSDSVCPRHPKLTTYRCSLPGLTGFVAPRRAGPGPQRRLSKAVPAELRPRAGVQPRYSGLRVQGTASSPSSTTASYPITAARRAVKPNPTVEKAGCGRTVTLLVDRTCRYLPEDAAQAPTTAFAC